MTSPPPTEFGKRKPAVAPVASPPVKRSRHVALLLTGTLAVGGSAYALMPRENCQPNGPGMSAPSSPAAATACTSRASSWSGGHGGSGGWWSRSGFYGGSSSSSGTSTASGSTETARGGFGGFARSIAAHFSGS
ncbi:hypothetical protein [Bradyrhizobium sp.]|uniref:hypothetical protein n=1 Tax=Bradyrhizobium sp. TaxID=376 RepID=UPI003C5BD7FE